MDSGHRLRPLHTQPTQLDTAVLSEHAQPTHTHTDALGGLIPQNPGSECGAQVAAQGSIIETLLRQKQDKPLLSR